MALATCPTAAELASFLVGNLDEPAMVQVAEHVEHCRDCDRLLTALDTASDPLVAQLRQASTPGANGG